MANKKGEHLEEGIWRRGDGEGYLAEVWLREPDSGRRIHHQKTVHRLDMARQWRQAQKVDALRGSLHGQKRKPVPFASLAREYLDRWSRVKKKESSHRRDATSVKRLLVTFGKRKIGEITRRHVEQYVATRQGEGVTPATVNRELCCIKNMLKKAVDWGYLESNPAWGVMQQKEPMGDADCLSEDEIEGLLAQSDPEVKAMLTLAVFTGMRRGEVFGLEWRDVDFGKDGNGMITVRDTKNHETRYVPLSVRVREALAAHPKRIVEGKVCPHVFTRDDGSPFTDVRYPLAASLKRAGIDRHITFHHLRHTFASQAVMKGVDLRTVARLGGWKTLQMVMRYAHLAPDHLQAAAEAVARPSVPRTPRAAIGSP